MGKETSRTVRVGPGFFSLLTLLFITLKLTKQIDWSWWWVLSPLWLPAAIIFSLFFLIVIFGK